MNLRLNKLAEMVDADSRVADIGTDHAYLPIELVKAGKIKFAIASDIAEGPLDNAKQDIEAAGVANKVETRLGPGLKTVSNDDHIDTIVIAGMGGKLMTQILTAACQDGLEMETLILEPNVGEFGVRTWLAANHFSIINEEILAEAGHIYEIIKAKKTGDHWQLTEKEEYFGPYLLQEKNSVFFQKWQGQLVYQQKLLANLNKAKVKDFEHIKQVEHEIEMIEGELS